MKKIIILILCCFSLQTKAETIENQAKEFILNQQKKVTADLNISDRKIKINALYKEIDKTFATDDIYNFVVGRKAKLINKEQKKIIIDYFKKMILVNYMIESKINTSNLLLNLEKTDIEQMPNGSYLINIKGNVSDSKNFKLLNSDFVIILNNNKFRIYDIKLENISMLISFRNLFNNMLEKNFNNINKFMEMIEIKLEKLNHAIDGTTMQPKEKEVYILQ